MKKFIAQIQIADQIVPAIVKANDLEADDVNNTNYQPEVTEQA